MPALAKELARRFTVFHYDRRGRGDSGNGSAYDVQREIASPEQQSSLPPASAERVVQHDDSVKEPKRLM